MTPQEARRALTLVTGAAVADATELIRFGPDALAAGLPEVIGAYALGSSALAADYYDESRAAYAVRGRFTAEPVIPDRAEKIRRASLWVVKPLLDATITQTTESRVAEVVQIEVARAHRETVRENTHRDPQTVGWKRITRGDGCKFCLFLAARGAVYRKSTARFAAHENCNCTAAPVFKGGEVGPEASVAQYHASGRKRTPEFRARLRDILNADFPDAPG